ncbi:glycosyl hydrolase 2 galactose-binding domain-containing protein [Diaminobutyricibacter sp. McL0618]|uniref:glycoside hydrolase family 2 protein n=1 Tax=Leifsonia sp. McL0618 TaxID=3415677 RepID=UPI003CFAE810
MTTPLRTRQLHDAWIVTPEYGPIPDRVVAAGGIPAQVPGVVHTDLLAAGLIEDPYVGLNERAQEWIGSTSWIYRTEFVWGDDERDERTDLHFHGLDTVATVLLNGEAVLFAQNQHRGYRVPVADRLRTGVNRLEVRFGAPVPEADRRSLELGYRPHVNHHPYNALRKMACSYGWDWGLDTATSGIWRPVALETWRTARFDSVSVSSLVEGTDGVVTVKVRLDRTGAETVKVRVSAAGASVDADVTGREAELTLRIGDVPLWWPHGYGDQPLVDLTVELRYGDGLLDVDERRIGFRTVRLDTEPDDAGTPFRIVVNDRAIAVKGVNWIPDDAFPSRVTKDRVGKRLQQAVDANVNLVRVWGGGIFESDDFYETADELGLLVWQDFLLACAAYSEEDPLRSEIEAEARENVARLSSHAALVVLNGNNENTWGYEDWGWKPRLEGKTWGAYYYDTLFPSIVNELAPHVGYTPGSPFSPDTSRAPNDPEHGTVHIWDLWNQKDYPHYRDYRPRFVAEFGWQGPPTWSTLTRAITDQPITPESPAMLVHQKAAEGNVKLTDGLVHHLPLPNTMPEWHWAMSLNQAVAIRTAIGWFRSLQPRCMGTILWQLNDCWPAVSWAAIDGDGRRKPLWYAMRDAYSPRLVTVQPEGDRLEVAVVNDTADRWDATVTISRRALRGEVICESEATITVEPWGAVRVPIDNAVAAPGEPAGEFLVAAVDGRRGFWWFVEPRDLKRLTPSFAARAWRIHGGVQISVVAHTLVREVSVLADIVSPEAEADRMLVDLLPGEVGVFTVRCAAEIEPELFLDARVLRHLGQLVSDDGDDAESPSIGHPVLRDAVAAVD